jgi:hypothetical protein
MPLLVGNATLAGGSGNDVLVGAGDDTAFGSLHGLGQDDVFAGLAPITSGILAATGRNDTAAIAGTCIIASLGYTEHHDTAAGSGGFNAPGSLSQTAGSDVLAAAGKLTASAAAAPTGGNDAASLAGMATQAAHLSAAGQSDTFAGGGVYDPFGILTGHGRGDAFGGLGGLATTAVMAAVERHDSLIGGSSQTEYHIYSNTNGSFPTGYATAGPIDYSTPIATTGLLTWTSSPLAFPGTWRFGVRAFDTLTMLEEENLDAAVTIILDAAGIDITNRPKAPTALRAFPRAGGTIRVEWAYNTINPAPVPTGFHVYKGTTGPPNYGVVAATVSFQAAVAGAFMVDLPGLVNGTVYTIGVRAFNSTAEEPNTVTVNCTADSTGPTAVVSLTATAIV